MYAKMLVDPVVPDGEAKPGVCNCPGNIPLPAPQTKLMGLCIGGNSPQ